jgi:hypothetical protein
LKNRFYYPDVLILRKSGHAIILFGNCAENERVIIVAENDEQKKMKTLMAHLARARYFKMTSRGQTVARSGFRLLT